jgi:hypothetical protein
MLDSEGYIQASLESIELFWLRNYKRLEEAKINKEDYLP